MSENVLILQKRTETGKKLRGLREQGLISSVVYGQKEMEPILTASDYNATEKVLLVAGYHSTVNLEIDGKAQLAIVKNIDIDPVTRKIINVEFRAVSASQIVKATAPIVLVGYETSEASKIHLALTQVMEEIDVKAKPAELPEEIKVDASKLAKLDDKITVADIKLPKGVELADKELAPEQVVASLYDPAVEAAEREAENQTEPTTETTEGESAKEKEAAK